MTIIRAELGRRFVGELLQRDLRVPPYQRPYRWHTQTAQALLDDVWRAFREAPDVEYALGSVILYRDSEGYEIVDGQQRLITLTLLLTLLRGGELPALDVAAGDSLDDAPPIVRVYAHLRTAVRLQVPADAREALAGFVEQYCALVQVVTDDEDEAFRFFDSQNYRGKALKPHDLLKAYHLREITDVRPEFLSTIVAEWEGIDDDVLEHLFSRYLYRIAVWSHGRSASREFTVAEIGLFKGISARATTPAEQTTWPRSDRMPAPSARWPSCRRCATCSRRRIFGPGSSWMPRSSRAVSSSRA